MRKAFTPCRDCKTRSPDCHANCEVYGEWKVKTVIEREDRRKRNYVNWQLDMSEREKYWRLIKHRRSH